MIPKKITSRYVKRDFINRYCGIPYYQSKSLRKQSKEYTSFEEGLGEKLDKNEYIYVNSPGY